MNDSFSIMFGDIQLNRNFNYSGIKLQVVLYSTCPLKRLLDPVEFSSVPKASSSLLRTSACLRSVSEHLISII